VAAIFVESTWSAPEPTRLYLVPEPGRRPASRPSAAVYRRRRLVAGVLAVLFVVVAGWAATQVAALGGVPASAPERGPVAPPAAPAEVVVRPGDTMWSIATRLQPEGDVRGLVRRLVQANGGSAIEPGDVLSLP
jgi:Tfp pilus assembly protein FimV